MERIYQSIIAKHFASYEQMAFLCGPRQVGKTTIVKNCKNLADYFKYLNWDIIKHREQILADDASLLENLPTDAILPKKPIIAFDEIHKYKHWKNFLKGFIDEYKGEVDILVTGSAKLNAYRHGGDSLAGRYFLYRIHPLSLAELQDTNIPVTTITHPKSIPDDQFQALFEFGGFPEPFLKQEKSFYNRWQNLRQQQVFRGDIRDLAQVQELAQLEVLASLLQQQAGQLVNYTNLAKKIRVADNTIHRWVSVLETFYYSFTIRPWTKNITRSLLKEPKIYLWDWSIINDKGAKIENFVACHLLKAVHCWTDLGLGKYGLYFLRDKDKREVDFLITENEQPWILLEVKASGKEPLSKNLRIFQQQIKAKHVLQLAFDLPYVEQDCLQLEEPKIVPLKTFLSQLV